ncbi:spermatogenesis-associated protein 6 isoform X2 [Colossoma macropomum]|uniref:spermatogenesis-associated protein 6 isoform X2 n=1 Tax=Colossoma macropomum TaxID=42526 RepID=UPI0018644389|nr:spermatogenesis-associated protein 6 isoform X2 [Colossoma macropomum]
MGGVTPLHKTSHSRVRRKALKCTVELKVHAITCPGVFLPSREDIYLSVRMMGQYRKTKCLPFDFPLLMHEKMVFTKTFTGAVDPGDIADHLENDTTCFELIQLVPPEGEILATLEENTRDFLYPGPRLTPQTPGSEREILMKKSVSFPGISPKVEFSTTSVIEECDLKGSQTTFSPVNHSHTKPGHVKTSPRRKTKTNTKQSKVPACGYQRPTVASQTRSPSPYTYRRMCQLSEEARQRLSHLQLGPYTFKKETDPQPPFVVPCSPGASLIESPTFPPALPSSPKRSSFLQTSVNFAADVTDLTLCGSFKAKPSKTKGSSVDVHCLSPGATSRSLSHRKVPTDHSTPLSSSHRDQSPLLARSSLRERTSRVRKENPSHVPAMTHYATAKYNLTGLFLESHLFI